MAWVDVEWSLLLLLLFLLCWSSPPLPTCPCVPLPRMRQPPEDAPDEDGGSDTDADATPAAAAAAHLRSASGFASAAGRGRDGPGGAQSRFARLENVHLLLIELAQVCPAVLLHVLPALSAGLDKANAAARHAAVRVLGRLFALPVLVSSTSEGALSSSKQPLARVYDVQFIGWLGRFKDR